MPDINFKIIQECGGEKVGGNINRIRLVILEAEWWAHRVHYNLSFGGRGYSSVVEGMLSMQEVLVPNPQYLQ